MRSQFSYTVFTISKLKFLVVVIPLSIYHGCSTRKTFWEEEFTGKEDLFLSVNMKHCCCRKIRKHKEIKGIDNITANFDSLKKMETTSFDSEDVVSIFFRLSKFAVILSIPLIYLCFLTLRRPQFFIFTDWNKYFLPVNSFSQNVFRVEQPW